MSCLELGLRHSCGDINSDAQYFVNDLPGVSIKKLANTADSDYLNAIDLFNKLCRSAEITVKNDFITELAKTKRILQGYDHTARKVYGTPVVGSETAYVRFEDISLEPFTKLHVKSLIVKFNINTDIQITITDGSDITTQSFNITKGFNTLVIDHTFSSQTGSIEFTSTGWESGPSTHCVSECQNTNFTYNVGFNSFMKVDTDELICTYSSLLEYPFLWQFGVKLMWEILNTDRVNYLVESSKGQARENIGNWSNTSMTEPGEYWSALRNLVKGIDFKINNEVIASGMRYVKFV